MSEQLAHALERVAVYRKDETTLLPYARSMIALADEIEHLQRELAETKRDWLKERASWSSLCHEQREQMRAAHEPSAAPADRQRLRNEIGSLDLEPDEVDSDNLAIALCSYFEQLPDCPEDGELDESETWKAWAVARTNRVLDGLVDLALERASQPPSDDLYALLVRRGYAQHEAHEIANMTARIEAWQPALPPEECQRHETVDLEDANARWCTECGAFHDGTLWIHPRQLAQPPRACEHGAHPPTNCAICTRQPPSGDRDAERYRWLRKRIAGTIVQRLCSGDQDWRAEHMDDLIDGFLGPAPAKCADGHPNSALRWICENCSTVNGNDHTACVACKDPRRGHASGENGG